MNNFSFLCRTSLWLILMGGMGISAFCCVAFSDEKENSVLEEQVENGESYQALYERLRSIGFLYYQLQEPLSRRARESYLVSDDLEIGDFLEKVESLLKEKQYDEALKVEDLLIERLMRLYFVMMRGLEGADDWSLERFLDHLKNDREQDDAFEKLTQAVSEQQKLRDQLETVLNVLRKVQEENQKEGMQNLIQQGEQFLKEAQRLSEQSLLSEEQLREFHERLEALKGESTEPVADRLKLLRDQIEHMRRRLPPCEKEEALNNSFSENQGGSPGSSSGNVSQGGGAAVNDGLSSQEGEQNLHCIEEEPEQNWWTMPDKERDEATQYLHERFPSEYIRIIEAYYRRLAEQERSAP